MCRMNASVVFAAAASMLICSYAAASQEPSRDGRMTTAMKLAQLESKAKAPPGDRASRSQGRAPSIRPPVDGRRPFASSKNPSLSAPQRSPLTKRSVRRPPIIRDGAGSSPSTVLRSRHSRSFIHRHGRRHVWAPGIIFWFYDGYYYGNCSWLYRRAIATGSPYWWERYYQCRAW